MKELIRTIGGIERTIWRQLREIGALDKTIELFFEGVMVLECPRCKTYNLCEQDNEEIRERIKENGIDVEKKYGPSATLFYCNKCEGYLVRYKKEG